MAKNLKRLISIILLIVLIVLEYFTVSGMKSIEKMPFENNMTIHQNNEPELTKIKEGKQTKNQNKMGEMLEKPDNKENLEHFSNYKIDTKYVATLIVENTLISSIIIYLIMSNFHEKNLKGTFINTDKIIIYALSMVILTAVLVSLEVYPQTNIDKEKRTEVKEKPKETLAEDIESGAEIISNNIDLNDYTSNITITNSGEYTLTGKFNYSILINAEDEVILNLNNVNIKNSISATIANISTNALVINLSENTENILSDGGSSQYDGCIYSEGPLTITGEGNLRVYGNQEEGEGIATQTNDITINGGNIYIEAEDDGINAGGDGGKITINDGNIYIKALGDGIDSNKNLVINGGKVYTMGSSKGGDAGIDTDDGFDINGGVVIALGSDMLEKPNNTSKQYSLCFNLDKTIEEGTLVTLLNEVEEVIVSFEAMENFKTLIISSDLLKQGTYYLYTDGSNTGNIENGIYKEGDYTKGTILKIKDNCDFIILDKVTEF